MSKKKKHEEHVNHERWLVSYADFITLLFAFFVVLFSSSQVDRSKSKKMALAIESAFQSFSIFKENPGTQDEEGAGGGTPGNMTLWKSYLIDSSDGKVLVLPPELVSDENAQVAPLPRSEEDVAMNVGFLYTEDRALARAQRDLMHVIEELKVDGELKVQIEDRGVVITLSDAALFDEGKEILSKKSQQIMLAVGDILKKFPNQIKVEGYTDTTEPPSQYGSNWDLSVARATYVVKWLVHNFKIEPSRFIATGYGQYRPVDDNSTVEGRRKNNRVDIILMKRDDDKLRENIPEPTREDVPWEGTGRVETDFLKKMKGFNPVKADRARDGAAVDGDLSSPVSPGAEAPKGSINEASPLVVPPPTTTKVDASAAPVTAPVTTN